MLKYLVIDSAAWSWGLFDDLATAYDVATRFNQRNKPHAPYKVVIVL